MLRAVLVGDRNSYTRQLSRTLNEAPNVQCVFYGPKEGTGDRPKKVVRFSGYLNYKPVWTSKLYALQILRRLLIDRPTLVHFDFTVTTFSENYFEMLFFPLLVLTLRTLRFKIVLTVHDVISPSVLRQLMTRNLSVVLNYCLMILYYNLLAASNVIIVHLRTLKSVLVDTYGLRPNTIAVIPFGVSDFEAPSGPSVDKYRKVIGKRSVILAFGLVAPRKGLEYLIDAFSRIVENHPEAMLIIAGPPDPKNPAYVKGLLSTARTALGKDQFSYAGYLDEESANSLISISRALVLPYLYSYASPSILYWAMAHRKPVVVSAIDTFIEELRNYNPILMPRPRDSKQIAESLERIFDDEEIVKEASRFMEEKAQSNSWTQVVNQILQIYYENFRIAGPPRNQVHNYRTSSLVRSR